MKEQNIPHGKIQLTYIHSSELVSGEFEFSAVVYQLLKVWANHVKISAFCCRKVKKQVLDSVAPSLNSMY